MLWPMSPRIARPALHCVFRGRRVCCTVFFRDPPALVSRLFVDLSYFNFVLLFFIFSNTRPCLLSSGFSVEKLEEGKRGATSTPG